MSEQAIIESDADRAVLQGPWRAVQQDDGDWEVRAVINEQGHYVLIAFDLTEAVAKRVAAAPDMLAAILTTACPGGGWNGQPKDIVQATVSDCLKYRVCGCDLGDAVRKATATPSTEKGKR